MTCKGVKRKTKLRPVAVTTGRLWALIEAVVGADDIVDGEGEWVGLNVRDAESLDELRRLSRAKAQVVSPLVGVLARLETCAGMAAQMHATAHDRRWQAVREGQVLGLNEAVGVVRDVMGAEEVD